MQVRKQQVELNMEKQTDSTPGRQWICRHHNARVGGKHLGKIKERKEELRNEGQAHRVQF